ncbi:hypothetical protein RDI58_024466 [Solanum bulbocastanum]|uniref:Uncharacterized protein n=1 Tax=Solanum bulbocastanum TaxID=147425 RepID=A0AAN8Y5N8_SOLBU
MKEEVVGNSTQFPPKSLVTPVYIFVCPFTSEDETINVRATHLTLFIDMHPSSCKYSLWVHHTTLPLAEACGYTKILLSRGDEMFSLSPLEWQLISAHNGASN